MNSAALTARQLLRSLGNARASLLSQCDSREGGASHWRGELSTSALSTATACTALSLVAAARPGEAARVEGPLREGRAWLAAHRNLDGGFGDTPDSPSNLSTTALAWTALGTACSGEEAAAHRAAAGWIRARIGGLDAARLAAALEQVYGADRTFAIPILTACAVGGAFARGDDPWAAVRPLPFELAVLPQRLFKWLGLPVVSYALPALIAIGQAIEHHRPTSNPLARLARAATRARTLKVLSRVQPENGGFLEATPLTSFVLMSLTSIDQVEHPVARRALDFLLTSVRPDGSWPIDTDLATWVTTLAINALGDGLPASRRAPVRAWLLGQQLRGVHPYTGADPGGWAWTDLPGGVPDADDSAGALLALRVLGDVDERTREAARAGLAWLASLQNRDGGIPTFCKGWGKLPFDKSSPDLTAHAMRAWSAWSGEQEHRRAIERGARFLVADQRGDGAWVPLWFGNQEEPRRQNPVYGTSRVLRAATIAPDQVEWRAALARGLDWLVAAQGEQGGFGGAPGLTAGIEETALALEALCDSYQAGLGRQAGLGDEALVEHIKAAATWLVGATDQGRRFEARPIGLYFAQLWYSERLYPLVFTVSALGRAAQVLAP